LRARYLPRFAVATRGRSTKRRAAVLSKGDPDSRGRTNKNPWLQGISQGNQKSSTHRTGHGVDQYNMLKGRYRIGTRKRSGLALALGLAFSARFALRLARDLLALLAGFGKADGDRLFAAFDLAAMPLLAALEGALLAPLHGTLDVPAGAS